MNNLDIIKLENEYMMQTYNRIPVVVERGEGAIFYDVDGKKYIDFLSYKGPFFYCNPCSLSIIMLV